MGKKGETRLLPVVVRLSIVMTSSRTAAGQSGDYSGIYMHSPS